MSADAREIFKENLKYYLDKAGFSQAEIAKMLGVSTAIVSNWVKGKAYPRIDKIQRLSEILNVNINQLMRGTDKEYESALTPEETELITSYRSLNQFGKSEVQKFISFQKSINSEKNICHSVS